MSTAQLSPGTVVDNRFTIGAPGWTRSGAQSYTATDEHGQEVLLTVYDANCFPSGLVMERSLRELRQLQNVSSPRVAPVIACGKRPEGGIYEVNASHSAQRLDERIAAGALSAPDAAALIEQVGEGLVEAQKVGVIHRNLGPRVVFVTDSGAMVSGFAVGEPHGDKSRGPLDTIAPEQVEGKVVDQRTLIYNLAALMHMLLTGAPLFPGDAAAQLSQHTTAEPPASVNARLRRALGKDPRMRPMMLKQFIAELRALGGGASRAPAVPSAGGGLAAPSLDGNGSKPGGAPSSRGWTMFMKAEDDGQAGGGATPAAPAAAEPAAQPKTRGWTMFMEAEGGDAAAEPEPEPEPAPAAKPSTRGWTMFMEAEGDDEAAEAAPAPAPEPEPAPAGGKPKTRGWTMFMEASDDNTADAVAAAEPAPAPAPEPEPAPAGGKPKTRGWTMFMEASDDNTADAVAAAEPAPAPEAVAPAAEAGGAAPSVPSAKPGGSDGPRSRGWTMFTEADDDEVAAAAAATPPAAAAPEPEPAPAEAGESDAPKKKRGWTMFMEKPIEDSSGPLGGQVPSTDESNAKGWTVFSPEATKDPAEVAAAAEAASEEAPMGSRKTVVATAPPVEQIDESRKTLVAGAAHEEEARRTLIATGETSSPGVEGAPAEPKPGNRPKTLVAPSGQQPVAAPGGRSQTMVTPPGSGPGVPTPTDPGAASGPISGPVSGPVSGAVSGPISVPVPAQPQAIAEKKSPVVPILVGVAVIGAIVAAVVLMS